VLYAKKKERITNAEYRQLCQVSMRTASRDLAGLVQKGIIEQLGRTGKGTFYTLKTPKRR
jgi:ATP-dependent DNA helicase RecG